MKEMGPVGFSPTPMQVRLHYDDFNTDPEVPPAGVEPALLGSEPSVLPFFELRDESEPILDPGCVVGSCCLERASAWLNR